MICFLLYLFITFLSFPIPTLNLISGNHYTQHRANIELSHSQMAVCIQIQALKVSRYQFVSSIKPDLGYLYIEYKLEYKRCLDNCMMITHKNLHHYAISIIVLLLLLLLLLLLFLMFVCLLLFYCCWCGGLAMCICCCFCRCNVALVRCCSCYLLTYYILNEMQ